MAYATAKTLDANVIPVIDITALRDGSNPQVVAQQLHAASRGLGFIYIKGHGITDQSIHSARDAAYRFFRSPDQQKSSVTISPKHRGWLSQGQSKMKDNVPADLKESYVWGYQDASGFTEEDHSLRGKNQWPDFVPEMQACAVDYFRQAHEVAFQLMRGFAIGLNLPEDFFLQHVQRPLSRASFVYYPAQPADSGDNQFGVAPHTDFGVLTVLCQDNTGGLQVQDIHGDWIHAPPIEDTLIVNVGDLLSRWTDGEYKSTPHRVVNNSGRERMSLVLAFDPEPDTLIDASQVFGEAHQPREPAITCGDYLIWRFAKAFSYREKNT